MYRYAFYIKQKKGYFYFFQDSARIIICNILSFKPLHEIYDICCELYDASEKEIVDEVNKFVDLLLLEGIIYE